MAQLNHILYSDRQRYGALYSPLEPRVQVRILGGLFWQESMPRKAFRPCGAFFAAGLHNNP